MSTQISSLSHKTYCSYFGSPTFSKCQIVALSIFIIISLAMAIGGLGWYLHINSLNSAQISMMTVGTAFIFLSLGIVVCRSLSKKNRDLSSIEKTRDIPKKKIINKSHSSEIPHHDGAIARRYHVSPKPKTENKTSRSLPSAEKTKDTSKNKINKSHTSKVPYPKRSTMAQHRHAPSAHKTETITSPGTTSSAKNETTNNFITNLSIENLYLGCMSLYLHVKHQSCKGADKYIRNFILDRLYSTRKDVAIFNTKGKIISQSEEPITFAYACAHGKKNNLGKLKEILKGYQEENQKRFIPKLFVSLAGFEKETDGIEGRAGHNWLLVIEPNPLNHSKVKVTFINPYGSLAAQAGHKPFEEKCLKILKEVFPSSPVIQNSVCQQQDNWSCGWHMLMNIVLLSEMNDIQSFVKQNRLPIRTSDSIKAFRQDKGMEYIGPTMEYLDSCFTDINAFERFREDLIAKGKLTGAKQ